MKYTYYDCASESFVRMHSNLHFCCMIDMRAKTQRAEGKIASDHATLMLCHTSMAFHIKRRERKWMCHIVWRTEGHTILFFWLRNTLDEKEPKWKQRMLQAGVRIDPGLKYVDYKICSLLHEHFTIFLYCRGQNNSGNTILSLNTFCYSMLAL